MPQVSQVWLGVVLRELEDGMTDPQKTVIDWQPMETMPRDGRDVMLYFRYNGSGHISKAYAASAKNHVTIKIPGVSSAINHRDYELLGWAPLPDPPIRTCDKSRQSPEQWQYLPRGHVPDEMVYELLKTVYRLKQDFDMAKYYHSAELLRAKRAADNIFKKHLKKLGMADPLATKG